MGTAGTIASTSINLVDQGNAENQMIGRKIIIKSIELHIRLQSARDSDGVVTNVVNAHNYRFMLVLDRQCNGAAATWANIFDDANYLTFKNVENSQRFRVIKEWKGAINTELDYADTPALYITGNKQVWIKWYKRCNYPIEFAPMAGGSRVIGEVKSNNLLLVSVSDTGAIAMVGKARIRYTDS